MLRVVGYAHPAFYWVLEEQSVLDNADKAASVARMVQVTGIPKFLKLAYGRLCCVAEL